MEKRVCAAFWVDKSGSAELQQWYDICQKWANYPNSPVLTSEWPCQAIVLSGQTGFITLTIAKIPMTFNNFYGTCILYSGSRSYDLIDGRWVENVNYVTGFLGRADIGDPITCYETNHNIIEWTTKTTTIAQDTEGQKPLMQLCLLFESETGTMVDSSLYNRTMWVPGGIPYVEMDTNIKFSGKSSGNFTGDIPYTYFVPSQPASQDDEDFAFGTCKFTIDCRLRLLDNPRSGFATLFDTRETDNTTDLCWGINFHTVDNIPYLYGGGSGASFAETPLIPEVWYHIAVVGNGGADGSRTIKCYIDGVLSITKISDYNLTYGKMTIGIDHTLGQALGSSAILGWIDNFRVVKGVELWTADFTPPTTLGVEAVKRRIRMPTRRVVV